MSAEQIARVPYDDETYDRLVSEREAANAAFRAAEKDCEHWGYVTADLLADGSIDAAMLAATNEFRPRRDEAMRLRQAWFDASDAVRVLTGRKAVSR